jgi:Ca2+-binding RTX toxin-like protein
VIHGGEGDALIIDMSKATSQGFQYPTTGSVASAFAGLGVDPFNAAITIGQSTDDAAPTQIYGNGGADTIYGGSGGDTIVAGAGPGIIYGGAGNDSISGGFGADTIYGGLGNNTIQGGVGNDTIYGGVGYDVGDPLALVSSGSNLLIGGAGNNLIYGDSKASNRLLGSAGSDTLYAGSGGDYLDGGTGADALYGGAGADTLVVNFNPGGGTDQDTLDGGGGDDTLLLKGPPNQDNDINLTLVPGTIETYSASLYNLDNNVYEGAVTFTLPPSVQQLAVYAGTGDTSPGVPANDKVVVDPSVQQGISIFGGDGNNTLVGGSGADTLVGGVGNNVLEGMGGNDTLYGDPGAYPANSEVSLPAGGFAPLQSRPRHADRRRRRRPALRRQRCRSADRRRCRPQFERRLGPAELRLDRHHVRWQRQRPDDRRAWQHRRRNVCGLRSRHACRRQRIQHPRRRRWFRPSAGRQLPEHDHRRSRRERHWQQYDGGGRRLRYDDRQQCFRPHLRR